MAKKDLTSAEEKKLGYVLDSEFVTAYAREYDLGFDEAKRIIQSVFSIGRKVLVDQHFLSLRGFGIFEIRDRKACRYKNNYTGQVDQKALTRVIKFRPARSIKDVINGKCKDELARYIKEQKNIKRDMEVRGLLKKLNRK